MAVKKLVWTTVALGALATALWAPVRYGYVTTPGAGAGTEVQVFNAFTQLRLPLSPNGPNPIDCGTGATGILGVQARNRLYVTNTGTNPGTISIINSLTLAVVNTVVVPNSSNLSGMALADTGNAIFIAGHNTDTVTFPPSGQAGIFRLDLDTETAAYVGGNSTPAAALDCDIAPAFVVGGSGNGAGKIYYSVPADNVIRVINIIGSGPTSIAPPAGTSNPLRMERAPDGSFLLVGCQSSSSAAHRAIRIAPGPVGQVVDVVEGVATGMSPLTEDVGFRMNVVTPPYQAYLLGSDVSGGFLHELSGLDATTTTYTDVGDIGFFNFGLELSYDSVGDLFYAADSTGTGANMNLIDASTSPPTDLPGATSTGGPGPREVAFMDPPPAPVVNHIKPLAAPAAGGNQIVIFGDGFVPGVSVAQFDDSGPVDAAVTNVIDQNTIVATLPALSTNIQDVIVENRSDGATDTLVDILQPLGPTPPSPSFTIPLPSAAEGYALRSFPQYARLSDFMPAVTAQLGPYNPVFYRIFVLQAGEYVEANQLPPTSLIDFTGGGFWVITRFGNTLDLAAPDVTQNTLGGSRVISLVPGWNIVSQPWINAPTNTIDYVNIQVDINSDLSNLLPAPGPWLSPQPYTYVNHQYFQTDRMTAGRAYWIFNNHSGPVYMAFNQSAVDSTAVAIKPGGPVPSEFTALAPGDPVPPAPPGAGVLDQPASSSGGGCGMLGLEFLVLGLARAAFHLARRRRRLTA